MIIAMVNQKGGVGKTTTAINVAACLGKGGKKVLVVDFDAQGSTTSGLGVHKKTLTNTTLEVVFGKCRIQDAIVMTKYKNLALLPAKQTLADLEVALANAENRYFYLKQAIASVKKIFDYIIIDCPPSLGITTMNALTACDKVIIPMQCEYFSLEGLIQIVNTIQRVKNTSNREIDLMGILFTMHDKRLTVSSDVIKEVKSNYHKDKVFKTEIPRNVKISEAPSHGEPVVYYDSSSKGAEAYKNLTKEILAKCKAESNKKKG